MAIFKFAVTGGKLEELLPPTHFLIQNSDSCFHTEAQLRKHGGCCANIYTSQADVSKSRAANRQDKDDCVGDRRARWRFTSVLGGRSQLELHWSRHVHDEDGFSLRSKRCHFTEHIRAGEPPMVSVCIRTAEQQVNAAHMETH